MLDSLDHILKEEAAMTLDREYCSFCGKSPTEVGVLHEGRGGVRICGSCLDLCVEVIEKKVGRSGDRRLWAEALSTDDLRAAWERDAARPVPDSQEFQKRLAAAVATGQLDADYAAKAEPPKEPRDTLCDFCGKSQVEVRQLVAGRGRWICGECVGDRRPVPTRA
jgi:ATP-dependent protease Clp ATPase subunit